ncbi:hypothetical protein OEZ86_009700 [Tetradesmus obliquus]|uniref:Transcription initiation factor TFIID subunit 8 n=1 Tax=Tetradesmus obliquus TaxID=3088 RepID=A0ABY8UR33_TETOB|nr:hypothetical protein OEZ85_001144 [Tetradesmus obliquus]WIA43190.1 hypothetical protein OEZ86_009700 [Tetradesmus obliquus]
MADEFSRSVARVIAAQIAETSGFEACQESAIEILADLLLRYLTTVCSSSHSYAELAGRSQSNLADVLLSLEELGVTADDLHQHLELQKTDVPFAHTLAPYPVRTQRPVPPTFADQAEPHPAHVPGFLPAFPDPHTYQHTAAFAAHEADPHKQRQSMLEAKQKAEAALNKLHQRMSSKAAQPDTNPFLAAPAVEQLPAQLPAAAAAAGSAGGKGPGDAYELQAKQQGRVAGVGGARQRKSKYDADPKLAQAEGILNLGPEAVFNSVGGMHELWDSGNSME